jgi:saccharopine dehydrogenase (NAD+, L-lysine-forming)
MALGPARRAAAALVGRLPAGADAAARARSRCAVWGEVRDAAGNAVSAALTGPDPYDLTADAVVRAVARLADVPPGAHTPATAFGPEFVETLDGVRVDGPSG